MDGPGRAKQDTRAESNAGAIAERIRRRSLRKSWFILPDRTRRCIGSVMSSTTVPPIAGASTRPAIGPMVTLNPPWVEPVQDRIEPCVASAQASGRFRFERKGYYIHDPVDSRPAAHVFNQLVPLRSSWAKVSAPLA
jgi:hypothetical protein